LRRLKKRYHFIECDLFHPPKLSQSRNPIAKPILCTALRRCDTIYYFTNIAGFQHLHFWESFLHLRILMLLKWAYPSPLWWSWYLFWMNPFICFYVDHLSTVYLHRPLSTATFSLSHLRFRVRPDEGGFTSFFTVLHWVKVVCVSSAASIGKPLAFLAIVVEEVPSKTGLTGASLLRQLTYICLRWARLLAFFHWAKVVLISTAESVDETYAWIALDAVVIPLRISQTTARVRRSSTYRARWRVDPGSNQRGE